MECNKNSIRQGWLIAAALVALSIIPVAAGVVRLVSLARESTGSLADARFFADPLPVQLHIVAASLFLVLGALLFWPGFRRRFPRWHRYLGQMVAPADIVAGLSGLWMNQFYPYAENDGLLLYLFRWFFGAGMVLAVLLGIAAILRRDIAQHRVWMMRAYAIGLGAGTQAATLLPWIWLIGTPSATPRALLMASAWLLNLAAAEWFARSPHIAKVSNLHT